MTILYLHQYFVDPSLPGATRSYEMARRWVAAGHEVCVITTVAGGEEKGWRRERQAGIDVHRLRIDYSNHMHFWRRIWAFLLYVVHAARRASSLDYDVVFATSTPLTVAVPGAWCAWRRRVPMVFEVRDLWPEVPIAMGVLRHPILKFMAKRLERFAYRRAGRVIALSPGMAAGVAAAGCPRSRIEVIPNACDIDLFEADDESKEGFLRQRPHLRGGPLVVYAGALGRVNGIGYLVRIAEAAKKLDTPIRFLVLGDGAEGASIRELAEGAGVLGKSLWLEAPVPKQEMPGVLAAATICVSFVVGLPELWKYSPNKVFDAFAAGRPVLLNHDGWLADIVRESGSGVVVPPNDPERAAQQLCDFVADEEMVVAAGAAAARLAKEQFSRDRLAAKALATIEAARLEHHLPRPLRGATGAK